MGKKGYPPEFRRRALDLIKAGRKVCDVARDLGISDHAYVHERMAILASNKYGLSGRNWASRFNYEWFSRLEIYRLAGMVRSGSAHALR